MLKRPPPAALSWNADGKRQDFIPVVALVILGLAYSVAYLNLPSHWWFGDDPFLYHYAGEIERPVAIFTDPAVLRQFTLGQALVPMQLLSYWLDVRLAGNSPGFAYGHQMVSFLLALVLLFLALRRWMGNDIAAFAASGIWMLLPSTAVVVQQLATRHYLEGMLFSALALYLAQRPGSHFRWPDRLAVVTAAAAAMLCKEFYAVITPALLLAVAWRRRDWTLALLVAALVPAYAAYRNWVIEPALTYGGIPYLGAWAYLRFVSKLGYVVTSNYGGYLVIGIVAALSACGLLLRDRGPFLVLATVLAASLAVVYPVSFPLYGTIREPGAWYRLAFVPHTALVAFAAYYAVHCPRPRSRIVMALVAIAVILPGTEKTRRYWVRQTESAEREGRFYLRNPGKQLLSEQKEWWFLPGIHRLYGVATPHYVLQKDLPNLPVESRRELWRCKDGEFVRYP